MSKHLQEKIEQLEAEVQDLRGMVQYLVVCKRTNQNAFFNWLVEHGIYRAKKERLDRVLEVLTHRLQGRTPSKKKLPGVSHALLYKDGPPTYKEATQLLGEALEAPDEHVVGTMLQALKRQGLYKELTALKPVRRKKAKASAPTKAKVPNKARKA